MASILYTESLQDWNEKQMNISTFLQQQQQHWGQSHFRWCEVLYHDTMVRLYTDRDCYRDTQPTVDECLQEEQVCRDNLSRVFEADENFDQSQIHIGTRHGYVPAKKQWKISCRCYVTGYKMRMGDIPALLEHFGPADFWDLAPYHARQKLGIPGACKGKDEDYRILQLEDKTRARHCIAQLLEGDEQELDFSCITDLKQSKKRRMDTVLVEWEGVELILKQAGFVDPSCVGQRDMSLTFTADNKGGDCPCCHHCHESNNWWISAMPDGSHRVKNYSERCNMMLIQPITPEAETGSCSALDQALAVWGMTGLLTDGKDAEDRECLKAKQHLEQCPSCSQKHANELWYIYPILHQCWSFRNAAFGCRERLVTVNGNQKLLKIMNSPTSDVDYVELFLAETKSIYAGDGEHIYIHHDNKWHQLADHQIKTPLQDWLKKVLNDLTVLLCYEQSCNFYIKMDDKDVKKAIANLKRAEAYIGNEGVLDRLRRAMVRKVAQPDFADKLDKSWNLLGVANGCVDLETCSYRPGLPTDYISMCVGYDWQETVDPDVEAELEEFVAQVYPVQAEKEFMQRYAGYCLTGRHPEKVFMMLTDKRGGWNGKSTFLSLLRGTMGEYAIKADASVLYKQDKAKGLNDHSGGLFAFEKKRLMIVEETDSSKVLDEERLKDWHGNRTTVSGRHMHKEHTYEFEMITKLILAANEGKLPGFSAGDNALVERMLTVPHRSRFQDASIPVTEEFTFPANVDIKNKFVIWYPYMLRWALQGLQRYQQIGFTEMPPGCLAFKQEIVEEKDIVKEWLDTVLVKGEQTDFVKVCDLYHDFGVANRSYQADKKTKKTSKAFDRELHRCLGTDNFKLKHQFRKDGKNVMVGKVFMTYRMQQLS